MAMQPPHRPADRAVDLSQRSFERKGHASSPGGPLWSPECDGSKTVDLSASSFELRCYCLGPSTMASPATPGCYCGKGRSPRWPGTTAGTSGSPRVFGMKHARSPGLPADLRTLMPPPASAKGWEARTRPAPPSEFPVPQPTYVSPPMLFAQRRSKQEQVAPGSQVTPGFTATWAIAQPPS